MADQSSVISKWLSRANPRVFSAYCILAAFGTYFCMYAFRKPFTAGTYEGELLWGVGYKTILIAAQVAGYTLSKFLGIKVVSEMPAHRRAIGIIALIAIAEGALFLFAVTPPPWNFVWLFLNGLPLGMVFGLVMAYLEGRRLTEALAAGLCASFIVSSGVVKTVGRSLTLNWGVSEYWMPLLTGLLFVVPLLTFVWLLKQIPEPNPADVAHRSIRKPMTAADRRAVFRRHMTGLSLLMLIYVALTVMRSIRDDFAVEIWQDMGHKDKPNVFAKSELLVMFGVVAVNGAAICIRSNRKAFLSSLVLIAFGFGLVLLSVAGWSRGWLSPLSFMVLIGLGTYIPYVAFHTTLFERLIAAFREPSNIGYLIYLADAVGYLGYVGVMVFRQRASPGHLVGAIVLGNGASPKINFLNLFLAASIMIACISLIITLFLTVHYYRRLPRQPSEQIAYETD